MQEDWALSSVFMFMDIRGCQDSNEDGLGDLPGLISRLDHFQEVGIGALVFPGLEPSDFSYVGTMMTEFCNVDPRYGGQLRFERKLGSGPAEWRIPESGDMEVALPGCGYAVLVGAS